MRLVSHELWPLRDIVHEQIRPMRQLHKLTGIKPPHATRIVRTECHEVKLVSFFVIPRNKGNDELASSKHGGKLVPR